MARQLERLRRAVVLLLVVAVGWALMMAFMWTLQRRLIYLPSASPVPAAAQVIDGARDVRLKTSDGLELGAWLVPPRGADRGFTVLVANGNAGDRSARAFLAQGLSQRGLGVLLFDYRGYGRNPGSPSEEGLARDVRAARDFLVRSERLPNDRLIYFGESLGAAVVAELATEHPPAGLVLRSPFTDLADVGRIHYPYLPVRALLRDRHAVADRVARIDVPTTVVYGTADTIVPPGQSAAVAAAAAGPTVVVRVDGAGHNDAALVHGTKVIDAVTALADRL